MKMNHCHARMFPLLISRRPAIWTQSNKSLYAHWHCSDGTLHLFDVFVNAEMENSTGEHKLRRCSRCKQVDYYSDKVTIISSVPLSTLAVQHVIFVRLIALLHSVHWKQQHKSEMRQHRSKAKFIGSVATATRLCIFVGSPPRRLCVST